MAIVIVILVSAVASLLAVVPAQAVCPVCTVVVGAGIGLSRWLGIDDSISGIWIGGITSSLILWTINWLDKKQYNFKGAPLITIIGYFLLIVVPLVWTGVIGHQFNKLWGIDKLMFGIVVGSIAFAAGAAMYDYLKRRNNNHAHFPFEKIVLTVAPLIILSFFFYLITK